MPVGSRMRRAAAGRWRPDPNGLFGGQQVIGHRSGMFSQAAIDTVANWDTNSRRGGEVELPYVARAAATGVRVVWFNDITDQNAATVGFTHPTPSVQMAVVQPDGATVQVLDLRNIATPATSLGNGVATPVTVNPRDALVGVPGSDFPVAVGDVVRGRIFVDRGNDTTTVRFPVQGHEDVTNDPGGVGTKFNVTGPATSHVGSSVAAWSALAYGALGSLVPFALLGSPSRGPMSNVLIIGDSVENKSLDATTQPDFNVSYVKRAVHLLATAGARITATSVAQGNETLQNLVAMLQVTTNARRRILGAGCWSHVFIGHGRNDIQNIVGGNGRTATNVINDYKTLVALVRSVVPQHTRIYLGTLPPYTDVSNNRLGAAIVDAVLAWQLGAEAASLFDHVFDVGAVFASNFDRQRWPSTALGDPANLLADGIHPGATGADVNGHGGHAAGAAFLAANPAYWTV